MVYSILFVSLFIKLPYYIDAPGGLINVSKRVQVDGGYPSEGSFNLAYVSEYEATLPMILLSYFIPDWDLYPKQKATDHSGSYEDLLLRDQLWIQEAFANATILAYQKANQSIEITSREVFITYVYEEAKTDLKVGDKILSVDSIEITSREDLLHYIEQKEVGDKISFKIVRKDQIYDREATIIEVEGVKIIGISLAELDSYKADPNIEISYSQSESGPSGGLMMSLAIYNALTEEDITGGLTIVGTGTIDQDGNVGEIGGVDYKLKGAVHKKADIFFVPKGENYEEAIAIQKKKKYDIEIVPVGTFDEALKYLEENVF